MATFGGLNYFHKVGQGPEVHVSTFSKLPVHALIHDPHKKLHASTRAHDPFLTIQKFDLLLYFRCMCLVTHLQSSLCMPQLMT